MKKELSKAYIPADHEDEIYSEWEKSGYFNPDNLDCVKDAEYYSIVMPPPNVTGILHLGHATILALQDILIRYNRMLGKKTLWLPGTDHASIATTTKIELLLKEESLTRHSLGREKFLKRLTYFAQESHDTISKQIKKMGSSCDWSREAYTLDKTRSKTVRAVFKLMHDDGLIYRGDRIINWCPRCQSTLADDEVNHELQHSILYTFKYSKDFPFSVSTTRPITKLGDTGIAINLKDERYNKHLGKTIKTDFVGIPLELKVVADRSIDMEFGSGAVGVTPAHSFTDWKIMEDHGLKTIKVINEQGLINENFGEFSGKTVKEAEILVINKIKEAGLLIDETEIENNIGICYRCHTHIEPLPSLQWFIDVNKKIEKFDKSIKEISLDAVSTGVLGKSKINIIPTNFEKTYFNWMDNLRDWCISRQIWFGHRIPVWYKNNPNLEILNSKHNQDIHVGIEPPEGDGWTQDKDTLDTWFSSGLWTFSTMANAPEQITIQNGKIEIDNADFKNYHPTNVLETGRDILPFWVTKMILMTIYATEDIPFKDVYLNGLVLDEKGQKMSKSKGNAIDPLNMIEKYGTDATRLSVVIGTSPGNDVRLGESKIANFRNFTNKLWNIARYILSTYDLDAKTKITEINKLTLADKWILSKLNNLIVDTDSALDKYQFSLAGENLRDFCWNDLADWYLEVAKFEKTKSKPIILNHILEVILKLWHPFMPFITETIWKELNKKQLLMVQSWPKPISVITNESSTTAKKNFGTIRSIITNIRNIRSQYKVSPTLKIKATIYTKGDLDFIEKSKNIIKSLKTGLEEIAIQEKGEKIKNTVYFNVGSVEVYLEIPNLNLEAEKKRLQLEMKNKNSVITRLQSKLNNEDFVNNAPHDIIKLEREKLGLWTNELEQIESQYNNL
ncbi:valine--tRNA ligase [Patescibacteria group bacterium]|nr:valine--tRNA ligase [Patescibacteria group bacterium]